MAVSMELSGLFGRHIAINGASNAWPVGEFFS